MPRFEGKVAVITGGSSGMALATAKLLAHQGAHVYITGRRPDVLDQAVDEIGVRATGIEGDAANLADLDRLYATVRAGHGKLDVLFASAGGGGLGEPLDSVTADSFDRVFDLNVRGTVFAVQKAVPLMTGGGSIVLNGTVAAVKGIPGSGVYSASKAALRSFVRVWAAEARPEADQGQPDPNRDHQHRPDRRRPQRVRRPSRLAHPARPDRRTRGDRHRRRLPGLRRSQLHHRK